MVARSLARPPEDWWPTFTLRRQVVRQGWRKLAAAGICPFSSEISCGVFADFSDRRKFAEKHDLND
jgi:hypothetical protein